MDKIVAKLAEIEEAAEKIVEHASEEKESLSKEMEKRSEEFDEQIDRDTSAQLEKMNQELRERMERELGRLDAEAEQSITALEKNFSENHSKLAEEILISITKA